MMAQFLGAPAISRTLDKLSYGEPLTTGAGGLGGTTRFNNDALEAAMTIAPMVGPAAKLAGKGAMATGRFVAPKAGELAEQYMVKTGGILPLDVYHGTPHTLPPTARNPLGEFDASKIGTGEGAQAYGHGIYTAENPAVAQAYQIALGRPDSAGLTKAQDIAAWAHSQGIGGVNPTNVLSDEIARLEQYGKFGKRVNRADYDEAMQILQKGQAPTSGNLYKIDLPDKKIAQMLDFDKPISEQPFALQQNLFNSMTNAGYTKEMVNHILNTKTGSELINDLAGRLPVRTPGPASGQEMASEFLRKAGIPGIKYLDEGSRSAGQGTRNFVVFPGEEKNMTILERNGQKFDNSALTSSKFVAPQDQAPSNLSYRGSHTAPGPDFGAPLHDLTGGGQMYPADVYSAKAAQYYGTGYPKADKEAFALAHRVRGNPEAEVTMYRAVPKDESITSINPGDWVTLSKDYAKTHGESVLENNYNILSQKVKAKDLWTNADSIHEFGYQPQQAPKFDNSALMK